MSNPRKKKVRNPLLVAAREEVVYLYGGEVERKLKDLDRQITEARNRRKMADLTPRRAGTRTDHSEEMALAEEYDKVAEAGKSSAVAVTVREVSNPVYRQCQTDNLDDEETGAVYVAGFQADLLREAIVDPDLSDEQWREFAFTGDEDYQKSNGKRGLPPCSPWNWSQLVTAAMSFHEGFNLPKLSAVSIVQMMSESESRQPDDGESAPGDSTAGSLDSGPNT